MPVMRLNPKREVKRWSEATVRASDRQIAARESLGYEATMLGRDAAYGDPVRLRSITRAILVVWIADARLRFTRKRRQYFTNLSKKEDN